MKHLLIWVGILLLALLLQLVFLPHILLQKLKIDLVFLFVIAFSLLQGSRKGLAMGLLAGVLSDSFVGYPFGFHMLLKGLSGAAVGRLNGMYLENQPGVPLLAAVGALLSNELLQHLSFQLFFHGEIWPSKEYWSVFSLTVFLEILIFLIIYYIVRSILQWEKRAGFIKD